MKNLPFTRIPTLSVTLLLIIGLGVCQNKSSTDKTSLGTGAKTTHLYGIDVSQKQGTIDWEQVKENGVIWGYARASLGAESETLEKNYRPNFEGMQANKILSGAYHFFYAGDTAEAQFANFESHVGGDWGDLPPMLDLEMDGLSEDEDISLEKYQQEALKMLKLMEQKSGKKPIIYSSFEFANSKYLNNPDFARYKLWVADYGTKVYPCFPATPPGARPGNPGPWSENKWIFWQFSGDGHLLGISNKVDLDVFFGTVEELKGLK